MYSDKLYWREREKGNAVYLHRIVVNPDFKGQKLFGELLDWAIRHAQEKKFRILRMDTWGDNPNLISYYKSFGFRFIENYTTPNIPELPIPHRNLYLALLELDIESYENNK
jgi:ribosomal protein S18 acetylase RimI-like enzyme